MSEHLGFARNEAWTTPATVHSETNREVIAIPAAVAARFTAVAIDGYPDEACGLLLGRRENGRAEVVEVTGSRSLATQNDRDGFLQNPARFLEADRHAGERGLEVIGVWHSRPDHPPIPSPNDGRDAWSGYSYVIVSVTGRRSILFRSWRFDDDTLTEERIVR